MTIVPSIASTVLDELDPELEPIPTTTTKKGD